MFRRVSLAFASLLFISALAQAEIIGVIQYPGGENGDLQFNDNGTFGGISRSSFSVQISTMNLDDLNDVSVAGASTGSFLSFNGTNWVAAANVSVNLATTAAFGSLLTSTSSVSQSGIGTSAVKLSAYTSAASSLNTSASASNDQITVSTAGAYFVYANIVSTGTGTHTFTTSIRVNGAMTNPAITCQDTPSMRCTMMGEVSLSSGDVVATYITASAGSQTIYVTDAQFGLLTIGGVGGGGGGGGSGSGDIEEVTAGTNLTGGGTSGSVTLNLADPITISSGTISTLNVSSIKFLNGSVQVSSPTAGGGGSSSTPINASNMQVLYSTGGPGAVGDNGFQYDSSASSVTLAGGIHIGANGTDYPHLVFDSTNGSNPILELRNSASSPSWAQRFTTSGGEIYFNNSMGTAGWGIGISSSGFTSELETRLVIGRTDGSITFSNQEGTQVLKISSAALTGCPGLTNSGKLTTDSNGVISCADDVSGAGGGVTVYNATGTAGFTYGLWTSTVEFRHGSTVVGNISGSSASARIEVSTHAFVNGVLTTSGTASGYSTIDRGLIVNNSRYSAASSSPSFVVRGVSYDLLTVDPATQIIASSGAVKMYSTAELITGSNAQRLAGNIFTMTVSSTVSNNTAETNLVGTGTGTISISPSFWQVGKTVKIKASGVWSSSSTAGNFSFKMNIGTTTIVSTTTFALANSQTNQLWMYGIVLTCRATGVSGSLIGNSALVMVDETNGARAFQTVTSSPVTLDLSINRDPRILVTFGSASISNTITMTNFSVTSE